MQLVLKTFSEGGREKMVNCIKDKEENQFHLMLMRTNILLAYEASYSTNKFTHQSKIRSNNF